MERNLRSSFDTYLRNCGRNEFHPGADCFNVKYSSKVLVVNGSNLTVPNFLLSSGPSPSKLIYNVQPLKPQSSESASSRMSSDIFCNKPQGSNTSPQERWPLFAARNSSSRRFDSAEAAALQPSSSEAG